MWSFCSVDFHTLTLQFPIQTQNSVAPELQVFVNSPGISSNEHTPELYKEAYTTQLYYDNKNQSVVLLEAQSINTYDVYLLLKYVI